MMFYLQERRHLRSCKSSKSCKLPQQISIGKNTNILFILLWNTPIFRTQKNHIPDRGLEVSGRIAYTEVKTFRNLEFYGDPVVHYYYIELIFNFLNSWKIDKEVTWWVKTKKREGDREDFNCNFPENFVHISHKLKFVIGGICFFCKFKAKSFKIFYRKT